MHLGKRYIRHCLPLAIALLPSLLLTESKTGEYTITSKKDRLYLRMIREVATGLGLEMYTRSGDWIILLKDPKTGTTKNIWGYSFDVNPDAAAKICNDKSATSDVLAFHKVPHVPHKFFITPSMSNWSPEGGAFRPIFDYMASCPSEDPKYEFDVVVKPSKDSSGGYNVFRCRTHRELESAVMKVFKGGYGLALSPYSKIESEYRVYILNNVPRLIYKKLRPEVIGDGHKDIRTLLRDYLLRHDLDLADLHGDHINAELDMDKIPAAGEQVPILWKFNLGGGATASADIEASVTGELSHLAVLTGKALGINFAAVDIVDIGGTLKVLEVNSGIMLEKAPTFLPDGEAHAKGIYRDAILCMFDSTRAPEETTDEETTDIGCERR